MSQDNGARPQLSYVLAAMTVQEVGSAVAWFRSVPPKPDVEVVLAAPASVFARIAGRLIPPSVVLASAIRPVDRKAVRVAGAQATTGLVVMVVDCDDDIAAKVTGPLATTDREGGFEDPATWVDPPAPEPAAMLALPPGAKPVPYPEHPIR